VEGDKPASAPISAKRQKILDKAFAELGKSRAAMDPKLLSKIRRMVASSPEVMKKLGLTETLKPDEDMPLSNKGSNKTISKLKETQKEASAVSQKKSHSDQSYESVDQEKNMEVMAKLMALNPKGRDLIKSAIKKATD